MNKHDIVQFRTGSQYKYGAKAPEMRGRVLDFVCHLAKVETDLTFMGPSGYTIRYFPVDDLEVIEKASVDEDGVLTFD